ncbi:MAG: YgjV family protein [Clostridia bacterium]|nr:YgjV family protein [Clostridia bacterium]
MFGEIGYIIGQLLSIAAVVTGFISMQMKKPRGILCFLVATSVCFTLHYFLIGANDALFINIVGTVMCVVYWIRDKVGNRSMVIPIIFAVITVLAGIPNYEGWRSLLLMVGGGVNAISLSLSNPQTTRKLNFIKSPLFLIYNVLAFSVGGIVFETAILTSSIIGLIRNRSKKDVQCDTIGEQNEEI